LQNLVCIAVVAGNSQREPEDFIRLSGIQGF
jgi:hypothetical protein